MFKLVVTLDLWPGFAKIGIGLMTEAFRFETVFCEMLQNFHKANQVSRLKNFFHAQLN